MSELSDKDKAWILQQMGELIAVLAYQISYETGARTQVIIDELPECVRLGVAMRRQGKTPFDG